MNFLNVSESGPTDFHRKPNVVKTTKRIFKKFVDFYEIVCCAEMQSGKSEVMKRVVEIVKTNNKELKEYNIDIDKMNVFIILCASSIDLKKQLGEKIPTIKGNIYHLNDIQKFLKNVDKYDELFRRMSTKSLVMFDECHCDVEQKKTVDKLRNIQDHLAKKYKTNFYRLGFSATPYEQVKCGYTKVIMKPGDNYYGIKQMFARKYPVIYQAKDLSSYNECLELYDEITVYPLYYIIRLPKKIDDAEKCIYNIKKMLNSKKVKFSSFIYDMNYTDNINDVINKAPNKMTIIYIKDKLRMGEYLDTTNVYMVHDRPYNSFAHTTVQSLIGRCCGYDKYSHNTLIYCDMEKVEYHYTWVMNDYDLEYIPPAKYSGTNAISKCYF